jgi:hypothetical protein
VSADIHLRAYFCCSGAGNDVECAWPGTPIGHDVDVDRNREPLVDEVVEMSERTKEREPGVIRPRGVGWVVRRDAEASAPLQGESRRRPLHASAMCAPLLVERVHAERKECEGDGGAMGEQRTSIRSRARSIRRVIVLLPWWLVRTSR